jgi:uncharacterized protein YfiM (DUF2279 family)
MTFDQITAEVGIGFKAEEVSKWGAKEFAVTKQIEAGELVITMTQSRSRSFHGSDYVVRTQLKLNGKIIAKKALLEVMGETSKVQENPVIKAAFLARAPELTADWIGNVRYHFKRIADSNNGVVTAFPRSSSPDFMVTRFLLADGCTYVQPADRFSGQQATYIIDEEHLAAAGKKYGEQAALNWFRKTNEKLGDVSDIEMGKPGETMQVTAMRDSQKIVLDQQRVFKYSSKGKPFHQFPARIYVDKKFHSEAAYKKMFEA